MADRRVCQLLANLIHVLNLILLLKRLGKRGEGVIPLFLH